MMAQGVGKETPYALGAYSLEKGEQPEVCPQIKGAKIFGIKFLQHK